MKETSSTIRSWQPMLVLVIIVGLFTVMAGRMIESARVSSATTDESIHILSGYLALKNGDYRLNPEHPFLGKMIAAAPHLFLRTPLPDLAEFRSVENNIYYDSWKESRDAANRWLYESGMNPQQILWPSRLTLLIVTLLVGLGLCGWAWRKYGVVGAVVTAGFYTLDPTILAHGQLANTDIWAMLGFSGTVLACINYIERPSVQRLVLLAVWFGIAMNLKFSLIILAPVLVLVWIVARRVFKRPIVSYPVAMISLLLGWAGVTLIVYSRDLSSLSFAVQTTTAQSQVGNLLMPWFGWLRPAQYWKGLTMVLVGAADGRPAYLLGRSGIGWWYYFPIAFLVKESVAMVLAFVGLLLVGIYRIRQWGIVGTVLACSLAIYWAIAMKSNLTLGIRHLLPVFPITILLLAGAASAVWETANVQRRYLIAVGLLSAGIFTSWSLNQVHPHYLPYFNEFVGGTAQGGKYLADSNIDWGQALPQLQDWLIQHHIHEPILLEYQWTGSVGPNYYGITYEALTAENMQSKRLIAVSRSGLVSNPGYAFLRSKKPTALVGNAIAIFDQR